MVFISALTSQGTSSLLVFGMASPLGPVLINIFDGYHENNLSDFAVKLQFYKQYMDETSVAFENESECNEFLVILDLKIQDTDNQSLLQF